MRIARNPGRVAGLWYLLLIIVGPLRLIYIPSKLFVRGNAAATVNNSAHEFFRMGIASELAGAVILIFPRWPFTDCSSPLTAPSPLSW